MVVGMVMAFGMVIVIVMVLGMYLRMHACM